MVSNALSRNTIYLSTYYTQVDKKYTVRWYKYKDDPSSLITQIDDLTYGSEAVFPKIQEQLYPNVFQNTTKVSYFDLPTDTSEERNQRYHRFTGWDKNTGYVTQDLDVYAKWNNQTREIGLMKTVDG